MNRPPKRVHWLLVRLLLYAAAAAFLFFRGFPGGSRPFSLPIFSTPDSSLSIAGSDLAPDLIGGVLQVYRNDYPRLEVTIEGGGTAHALEALINRRADAAFLSRPPTLEEQNLFRSVGRDTALWFPVAVGGLVLVRNPEAGMESLSVEDLRRIVSGEAEVGGRLYVPDPNLGVWDALKARLGLRRNVDVKPAGVVYLATDRDVVDAVRVERGSLGVVSTLALPDELEGVGFLAVADSSRAAESPTDEAIATSRYPLHHYLYVACAKWGTIEGSMFVTYLTSDRGQRGIERAGYLPARQVLREIHLSTRPLGGKG